MMITPTTLRSSGVKTGWSGGGAWTPRSKASNRSMISMVVLVATAVSDLAVMKIACLRFR
jgi:hypothetical protein